MKEMVYKNDFEREVLYSGEYGGRKFHILSLGTHPTAYVSIKEKEEKYYHSDYFAVIEVHGGFTFCGSPHWDLEDKTIYIGWDYAHHGDCFGIMPMYLEDGKKWTTTEIFEEVKDVINQLNKNQYIVIAFFKKLYIKIKLHRLFNKKR